MNRDGIERLTEDVAHGMAGLLHSEAAELFADQAVSQMVDDGMAIELTDDEERLLKAYRQFRCSNNGGVFKWRVESERQLIVPTTPVLIQDPRDMSLTGAD